jgi:hypothetical protein
MKRFAALIKAAGASVGFREAALLVGLGLVGYGAGSLLPAAAYLLPGAVLVYIAIAGLR